MDFIQLFLDSIVGTAKSLAPFAPLIVICLVSEKIWGKYDIKNKDIATNVFYTLIALSIVHSFIFPKFYTLNQYIPNNIASIETSQFSTMQKVGYWALYLVAFDFLYYCFHRAQHTFAWMWRYHMVHHVDENISSTAFAKHHWLEDIWRYTFITAPLLILFNTSSIPYLATVIIATLAIFMHWNTPLRFGVLEKLIITPHYHRIHHSIQKQHYNKNFGAILQLWDYLFKTRYIPKNGEFPQTGVKGVSGWNFYTLLLPIPLFKKDRVGFAQEKNDSIEK